MTEGKSIINANLTPLPDKVGVDGLEDKWRTVCDCALQAHARLRRVLPDGLG